jgi:hypothetical protein
MLLGTTEIVAAKTPQVKYFPTKRLAQSQEGVPLAVKELPPSKGGNTGSTPQMLGDQVHCSKQCAPSLFIAPTQSQEICYPRQGTRLIALRWAPNRVPQVRSSAADTLASAALRTRGANYQGYSAAGACGEPDCSSRRDRQGAGSLLYAFKEKPSFPLPLLERKKAAEALSSGVSEVNVPVRIWQRRTACQRRWWHPVDLFG